MYIIIIIIIWVHSYGYRHGSIRTDTDKGPFVRIQISVDTDEGEINSALCQTHGQN